MPDEFVPQLLPDDNEASDDVWYCRSFGSGYEYDKASRSVLMPTGEQSKLPDHMGVHLTGSFDWELLGMVPVDSVAAINASIGVQGSLPYQAQSPTERQSGQFPALEQSALAGPSTAIPGISTYNANSEFQKRTALSLAEAILRRAEGDRSCTACLVWPTGPRQCYVAPPVWNMWSKNWEQQLTTEGNTICTLCSRTARFSGKTNISNDCDSVYIKKP